MDSRGYAAQQEGAVNPGEHSVRGSYDRDFNVGDGLLGRAIDDLSLDRASGILRAKWDCPCQTSDQRGNDVTEQCHTSALYRVGVEYDPRVSLIIPPNREMSRMPKEGGGGPPFFPSEPGSPPCWWTLPFYSWPTWRPILDVKYPRPAPR